MLRMLRALSLVAAVVIPVSLASCGDNAAPANTNEQTRVLASATTSSPSPNVPPTVASTTTIPGVQPIVPTAPEIAAGALKASQEMKSLKFDIDYSMSLSLPTGNETGPMSMQETGAGSIDIQQRQMDLAMNMSMDIPNQGKQNRTAEIYSTDGWMYVMVSVAGAGDQWTKMKLTDELWTAQSRISSVTDFLKSPVGLQALGSESVGGVDCYVLNITPDMTSLSNWVAGQAQAGQNGVNPGVTDMSKDFQNIVVKEWIGKNTLLPVKEIIAIKMDTTSGGSGSGMELQMNVSLAFHDYGTAVTVQLPPEALNAKELVTAR